MIVSFALKNQIIRRTDYNIVVAQSKNYLRARFDALSDDWIGPITAIFNEYTVLLDGNNECLVPWEVLQNQGVVNVSAFCGDLHTASVATMVVKPSGYTEGETPEPPTPGVYAQLTQMVQDAVESVQGVEEAVEQAQHSAEQAAANADNSANRASMSAFEATQKAAEATDAANLAMIKAQESAASAELAQQGAENAGWFTLEPEDGYLYMMRSDNSPVDFDLRDDGNGNLEVVYGDET